MHQNIINELAKRFDYTNNSEIILGEVAEEYIILCNKNNLEYQWEVFQSRWRNAVDYHYMGKGY